MGEGLEGDRFEENSSNNWNNNVLRLHSFSSLHLSNNACIPHIAHAGTLPFPGRVNGCPECRGVLAVSLKSKDSARRPTQQMAQRRSMES